MGQRILGTATLTALAALLTGCIALPIPMGEGRVTEGREITRDQSAVIEIGGTSRETLLARLGDPEAVWEECGILVYAWDRVHLRILWVLAGPATAAAGLLDVPTHYLLLIQLDEAGRARRAERCVRPLTESFGDFLRDWADGRPCA